MKNYFLSHVFDKDGAPGAEPGAPAAGDPPGNAPAAGDPGAAAKDPAAPKEPKAPKERSKDDVVADRFAELTRRNTEAARRADAEKTRADKAERELQAARELLARQPADPNADPAAQPAPKFRPVLEERSLDEILNSDEGKQAIARRATAEREAAETSARGDEIYEKAVEQFGEAKVTKALANFKIFDGIKPELAEAVFELGEDAPAVLMEIASKPAIIEQLYKLTPVRLAARVAALATTIKKPAISNVKEPPGEMGGRGNSGPIQPSDTNTSMADWVRSREEDLKRRGVRL